MKKLIAFFLLVLISRFSIAQNGRIVGMLREKSSDVAVEYATITLLDAATDQIITGCTTDPGGSFSLENIKSGKYVIEASFVGFKPVRSQLFNLLSGKTSDLGTLYIEDDSKALDEVVVEVHRSTLVARLDRKVFNVGADLMSSSGSASDLMQNIPSLDVDMDGTVSLRGNENVTILINGKPSAMMNPKTRGDALNQLSASNIDRIEVVTNPSAEYKPDGVSGIINIVLKKDAKAGVNGSLLGNVGSAGRGNAAINLNYGLENFNFFGGYTYRRDRYDRSVKDTRTSSTDKVSQMTEGLGRPISHTFRLGLNIDFTPQDQMEVAGSYNHRDFRRNERLESVTLDRDDQLADSYFRDRSASAKEAMWESSFRYAHSYGKENEWSVDYSYSSESEDEMNHYSTLKMLESSKDNQAVWDASYLHTVKFNWKHIFSDRVKLSSGYEMEHLRCEQNFHLADLVDDVFIPNVENSSDFTHYRMLHSLYSTLEISLSPWSFLLGVRGEYSDIENHLLTYDQIFTKYSTNLYPTVHISRQIDASNELQVNYSLRVNRPEGDDMNPFSEQINPLSVKAGNPDLNPEKIHSVELGWLWHNQEGMSLMSTLYYRYLTDKITEVSHYQDNGILLTTKQNLDSNQSAGAELIWNFPVAGWFSFNCNVNGYYDQIDATRLGYGKNRNTVSWSSSANANITPFSHFMIQLNARYRSARLIPQGQRDADCRINLGMKYDIPSANLSFLVSVTDLFDTYRKSYTLDTPELKQNVEKRRNPRIFYIGMSWQFGTGKNKKTQTKVEYDEGL